MTVEQSQYEELLAQYSDHFGAIALLQQFRPYLELIPSMRRPQESIITIPLPLIRIRHYAASAGANHLASDAKALVQLPCDVAILMCDPEWKVKTGVEIFVFIHRPQEDFSELLNRWRQTQTCLDKGYEWLMPARYRHVISESADETYPLFVIFPETPERIARGLRGAGLPFVTQAVFDPEADTKSEIEAIEPKISAMDDLTDS
ncbi:hypothetical protein IQ268_00440 [Oculatella sp. LEGE 06141]|uniref:hypothetical protein n=1 Tax=Oculatella sp. LEGE 06141 TaxID=1828648 RepID=UPI001881E4B9|nr:hypothetical protein [Oculatella sp. LEGE 06141]MBE9177042.1 hypothetical protein [Oculatella sp. LEGE 06141]